MELFFPEFTKNLVHRMTFFSPASENKKNSYIFSIYRNNLLGPLNIFTLDRLCLAVLYDLTFRDIEFELRIALRDLTITPCSSILGSLIKTTWKNLTFRFAQEPIVFP